MQHAANFAEWPSWEGRHRLPAPCLLLCAASCTLCCCSAAGCMHADAACCHVSTEGMGELRCSYEYGRR